MDEGVPAVASSVTVSGATVVVVTPSKEVLRANASVARPLRSCVRCERKEGEYAAALHDSTHVLPNAARAHRALSEAKGAGGEALVDCTGVDDAAEVLQSCMNAGSASGLSAESPRILNHQA